MAPTARCKSSSPRAPRPSSAGAPRCLPRTVRRTHRLDDRAQARQQNMGERRRADPITIMRRLPWINRALAALAPSAVNTWSLAMTLAINSAKNQGPDGHVQDNQRPHHQSGMPPRPRETIETYRSTPVVD